MQIVTGPKICVTKQKRINISQKKQSKKQSKINRTAIENQSNLDLAQQPAHLPLPLLWLFTPKLITFNTEIIL